MYVIEKIVPSVLTSVTSAVSLKVSIWGSGSIVGSSTGAVLNEVKLMSICFAN